MGRIDDFLQRPTDSYGRGPWILRMAVVNLRWARHQGVRRLLEEHELHPGPRLRARRAQARWLRTHAVPAGSGRAVFLAGAPRSGTNMLVRALATSPAFQIHNEGDPTAFHRRRLRSDDEIRRIVATSRHAFVLFKPLLDSHRIAELLDGVGGGRPSVALWALRDVDGRVRSSTTKFGDVARRALREIAAGEAEWRWQADGLSPTSRAFLQRIDWERATPADGAAAAWYIHNRLFFEQGLDRRPDVRLVRYDALVRDPAPALRAVCEFVGVPWDPRMAGDVDQRSIGRHRPLEIEPEIRVACDDLADRFAALDG